MSDLTEFQDLADELLLEFGTTCVVIIPNATVSTGGIVTEAVTAHTVQCTDLVDDSRRYATQDTSQRVTGTIYLGAAGLAFVPAIGQRVTYQARTLAVVAVFPYRVQGGVAMWRLDLAEIAGVAGG